MLAGLAFVGCTSGDDVDPNGGNSPEGTRYLTVNLVSSDATRAEYENGTDDENKVTSVRFYFFNSAGGAANVKLKGTEYVNYFDWTAPTTKPGTPAEADVEKILSATIIIDTSKEDKLPARVAAIVNPTEAGQSRSLSELQNLCADYAYVVPKKDGENKDDLTTPGKFVMFNSVYRNDGKAVHTTVITKDNLQDTPDKALANPVKIYVERSVAKVSVELAAGFENGKLALKTKDGAGNEIPLLVDGKQVYLEILGWDLAAETNYGRLVKRINPSWDDDGLFGSHRSFWAVNFMNNELYTNRNVYDKSYDDIKTSPAFLYTNENAQKADTQGGTAGPADKSTKVILAGKLMDSEGNALNIVRHAGAHFVDNDTYTNLRTNILRQLGMTQKYYYAVGTDRKQIDIDDIEIVNTETQEKEESDNNCYVYAQLTKDAKAKTWYDSEEENAQPISHDVINTALKDKDKVSWPLVWNNGMTYYFYEINHLEGYTGVVRNHVYKTRVTKILGLGTPVYNPGDIIYPEKPDPKQNFIAAEVQILSWRIISNDNVLEW